MTVKRRARILLVEDSPTDVRLTREAFRETDFDHQLDVAENGEDALRLLRDPAREPPDLILLDLNLPGLDGREVLEEIKSDPRLHTIPVVVLTTSQADPDVLRAYRSGANCYVVKPIDLDRFFRIMGSIREFWFGSVRLPPR